MKNIKFIDLSHTIEHNMPVFPNDKNVRLQQIKTIDNNGFCDFLLNTGMHVGTHIDTPMHMLEGYETIDNYKLNNFIGKGVVLNVENEKLISYKEDYEKLVNNNDIVLLYTGHSKMYYENNYFTDYPIISKELGDFFVKKNIKMLGIDAPSPDKETYQIHKLLFSHRILIIENLTNLDKLLNHNNFIIYAIPFKIKADASFARVFAVIE